MSGENLDEHGHGCCSHHTSVSSIHQTMDEMEFERGIWSAALNGEEDRVIKFLSGGTPPDVRDNTGYAALHYAARAGHLTICHILLQSGADVDSQTRSGGATPLHRAAYCGHRDVVDLLLRHKADVVRVDKDGRTATHKAAEKGHKDILQILRSSAPASLSIKDNKGQMPIDCLPGDKQEISAILQFTTQS